MQKFTKHTGKVIGFLQPNIDTDQILPKQFLKRTDKSGYGDCLFYDWRFDTEGNVKPDFILNQERGKDASVLLAGQNFGSGSSREHAVWSLYDFGFRVIFAPSFADIFYNNCFKTGLLPIVLGENEILRIAEKAENFEDYSITTDLGNLKIYDDFGFTASFQIDNFRRELLIKGLDEISLTMQYADEISEFERCREDWAVSI